MKDVSRGARRGLAVAIGAITALAGLSGCVTAGSGAAASDVAPPRAGAGVGPDEAASSCSDAKGPGLVAVTKLNLSA